MLRCNYLQQWNIPWKWAQIREALKCGSHWLEHSLVAAAHEMDVCVFTYEQIIKCTHTCKLVSGGERGLKQRTYKSNSNEIPTQQQAVPASALSIILFHVHIFEPGHTRIRLHAVNHISAVWSRTHWEYNCALKRLLTVHMHTAHLV